METLLADRAYYEESGGGVTLSGGEPVLQKAFAAGILSACKAEGIHTALQTAGNYPFSELEPLLPHLDMIMYDIKGFDPEIYSRYIRGSRDRILNNLKYLAKQFPGVLAVRTPCVGSVNDTDEEIEGIARLLAENGNIAYYQLLPYHGLGKAKYDALGEAFADYCYTPPPSRIEELERIASRYVPVFRQDRGIIQG
jgi:pyruvate formate lyase activating enzyme